MEASCLDGVAPPEPPTATKLPPSFPQGPTPSLSGLGIAGYVSNFKIPRKNVNKPLFLHFYSSILMKCCPEARLLMIIDRDGTLRSNLPPELTVGTHFTPLQCPEFK